MKPTGSIILIILFLISANTPSGQKYIFYLHGRIIEEQGARSVSSEYGAYQYDAILDTFRQANFSVISEVRKKNTDVKDYARKVVSQVDSLLKKGVKPNDITIVGASKGSMIAMYVSTFLKNEKVNFVFIAGCFDDIVESCPDINYCGNILSIFEKSDQNAQSCLKLKTKTSASVPNFKEIETNTGLKHGFLFQPLPDWIKPTIQWAKGNYN